MSREELKISILIKGDRILIGVQATDCDPKMTAVQGTLQDALNRIPTFITEANQQWDTAPRNPKATNLPVPPAPIKTTSAPKPAAKQEPAKPAVKQQSFF